jgi:phenylacetate-CoA ligase
MAERVIFATECSAHEGHHINSDYGITEVLDNDNQAVAAGEMGRIVGTGLYNFAMPLIRYVSSDVSGIQTRRCSCGRAFPLMHEVTTRAEDMITATDGRYISFASMTLPLKITDQIEASQIIQEDRFHILLRLVKRPGYTDADSAMLVEEFKKRLGTDMNVEFDFVDEIPRTRSGKFRFVVSKVPLEF